VPGGQHHDGDVGEVADALADLEPVDVGEADVEEDEIRRLALDEFDPQLAGGGRDDLRLRSAQAERQANDLGNVGFVVNDQHSHVTECTRGARFRLLL